MTEHDGGGQKGELTLFVGHWQEIEDESGTGDKEDDIINKEDNALSVEERAAQLYLQGKLYENEEQSSVAVHYYRHAVDLVPDIEFKLAESRQPCNGFYTSSSDMDGDLEQGCDNTLLTVRSFELGDTAGLCSPCAPQTATHISALPTELLSKLFRWIVSKDLDTKPLSQLSLVCKWFHSCARDEDLWKQICLRVWGSSCNVGMYNNCWRQMFQQRARVNFDGVYISSNSYVHCGAPIATSFYQTCELVEYYKYLRFFANGTVLVYTSAEDPQSVVQLLRRPPYGSRSVHTGYYSFSEANKVNVHYKSVVKLQTDYLRGSREKSDIREHNFFMDLTITNSARNRNGRLLWNTYTYQVKNRKTGDVSENPISFASFKPFVFSRVQSYLSRSLSSI